MLLTFSFNVVPAAGSGAVLVAATLARSVTVQLSVATNVAATMGVPPATVKLVSVADIATGTVTQSGLRMLQGGAGGAAGSKGVAVAVAVNLGKTASPARINALTGSLQANFTASSPAFAAIISSVASQTAGVSAAQLAGQPPAALSVGGTPVGGAASGGGAAAAPGGGAAITDEVVAGVVAAALIIAVGFSLYVLRSYKVHGKAPWQRDRKREAFERQQRIEQELEDKLFADSVAATVANPLGGKSALTLRVPKAVAAELEALRAAAAERERRLEEAEAKARAKDEALVALRREGGDKDRERERTSFAPVASDELPPNWKEVQDPASGVSKPRPKPKPRAPIHPLLTLDSPLLRQLVTRSAPIGTTARLARLAGRGQCRKARMLNETADGENFWGRLAGGTRFG